MTTTKRAEANRRNARKSTGPKTAAGKDRSRFNAVKHGMRAQLPVLPGEDAEAYRRRLDAWNADLRPRNDVELYLVEQAVHASWQLDRAHRAEVARLDFDICRAAVDEATEQADEVAALGRRLFWDPRGPIAVYPHLDYQPGQPRVSATEAIDDPDQPARIVVRLESTAAGCRWLLDRWGELRRLLEAGTAWQAPDRLRAIRLLGRQPLDAIDDDRVLSIYLGCAATENPGDHEPFRDLRSELNFGEIKIFNQRLAGRREPLQALTDPDEARARLLAIVAESVTRLEALLAAHDERTATQAARRSSRLSFDASDGGERLRRHQATCGRTLLRTIATLEKLQKADRGDRPDDRSGDDGRGGARCEPAAPGVHEPAHDAPATVPGSGVEASASPCDDPPPGQALAPNAIATIAVRVDAESPDPTNEAIGPDSSVPPEGKIPPARGRNATNEPTRPAAVAAGRRILAWPVVVLALLALSVGAGLAAALGGTVEGDRTAPSPRILRGGGHSESHWLQEISATLPGVLDGRARPGPATAEAPRFRGGEKIPARFPRFAVTIRRRRR